MQGLRVPNSYLDLNFPGGILDDRYFRGSGTSQSAAVISGAVALILQKYPAMSPDQVKAFLADNANSLSVTPRLQGNGEIDLHGMLTDAPPNAFAQWARLVAGQRVPRTVPRHRPRHRRRRDPRRRAGHLRPPVQLGRDGRPRGRRQVVVGWRLERQQLERQQLVRQLVVRQQLEWQQLVRQLVVRQQLVREHLVRQLLVRELVVRQQLVRELVVRQQLEHGRLVLVGWRVGGPEDAMHRQLGIAWSAIAARSGADQDNWRIGDACRPR